MAKLTPESAWEFADAIKAIVKPQSNRRKATVQNVDKDGTIWVSLPGSSTITPIQSTGANVSPGDTVLTELRGTSLHITENQTNPAIGENTARSIAKQETQHAEAMAKQAKTIADEANAVAQATNQHFWNDTNGAHITDVTQDEWTQAVEDEFSDYDPTTKPYHNQLLNSLGILLRTALNNLVSITRSAIAFYDGTGNTASNIVARFGSAGAQIGRTGESRLEIDYHSMQLADKNGNEYFHVSDLRDSSGSVDITEAVSGIAGRPYVDVGCPPSSVYYVKDTVSGTNYTVNSFSGTRIYLNQVLQSGRNIEVSYSTDSNLAKAMTFGVRDANAAVGALSFATGEGVIAAGMNSFASGSGAAVYANNSAAFGNNTAARAVNQVVLGKFNILDYFSQYALIIGNGTADNARSNALVVKWDGTVETAQDIPWTTLTLARGWSAYSTARTPKYRRVGSLVEIRGGVKPNAETSLGTSAVTFGNLPQGCRPVNMEVSAICQGSGVKVWLLTVDTAGNVCASRMRTMNSTSYQTAGTSEFMVFDVQFMAG